MVLFLGIGPPSVNPGVFPSGQHLRFTLGGASSQWSASISLGGVLPISGSCPFAVGGRRWALSRRRQSSKSASFYFPLFFGGKHFTLFQGMVLFVSVLLDMLVAKWKPIPCYVDAFSVGTLSGHFGGKAGKCTVRPCFHPFWVVSFC